MGSSIETHPEAKIVGVYRRRNVARVLQLLEPAIARGWTAAWWALDGTDPALDDFTVGQGSGERFPLLNRTLALSGPATCWTVIADDDVRFRRRDVVEFLRLCQRAGLDLAQPARARGTDVSHAITVAARLARARSTTFVECGPLFAVGPRCRDLVLPLPDDRGMGWGVELDWFDLIDSGCRLGIVDAAVIEHVGKAGDEYDTAELFGRLRSDLDARGARDLELFQRTLDSWRPWQRRPAWVSRGS